MHRYYTKVRIQTAKVLILTLEILACIVGTIMFDTVDWIWIALYYVLIALMCVVGGERIILLQKGYWLQKTLVLTNEIEDLFNQPELYQYFVSYVHRYIHNNHIPSVIVTPGHLVFDYFVYVDEYLFCMTLAPEENKIVNVQYRDTLYE